MIKKYSLYFAWLVATIATLLSLFLSEVKGIPPCTLCWYQRIFLFPLPLILFPVVFMEKKEFIPYFLSLPLFGLLFSGKQIMFLYDSCTTCVLYEYISLLSLVSFFLILLFLFIALLPKRAVAPIEKKE